MFDPNKHHRRSIRLKEYDYAQPGAYFVTICTHNRMCLFGDIANGEMVLKKPGEIVLKCWHDLPEHYFHVILDSFVIMPNHVHGIVILSDARVGAGFQPAHHPCTKPAPTSTTTPKFDTKRHGLSEIIRALKTYSARRINVHRQTLGIPVWQRDYYEHIVRNDRELHAIQEYIQNNPKNWTSDPEHPKS